MINSNHKIKVMHILSRLETGGLENGVVNICNNISRDKFIPMICCLKDLGSMLSRLKSDVEVINMKFPEGKDFLRPFKMAALFRNKRPDIVHAHAWGQGSFSSIIGARLAGIPVVINGEHGTFFTKHYQIIIQHFLAFLCNSTLSVSEGLKGEVNKVLKIPVKRIKVIKNGVNTGLFAKKHNNDYLMSEIKQKYNVKINDYKAVIISVGSLKNGKNQIMAIQAIEHFKKKRHDNNVLLILIGDGPQKEEWESYVRYHNLSNNIIFLGLRDDVDQWLSLCDIFVSCSLSQQEGLSNVILEAMSSGLLVIATRSVGTDEIISDMENGVLLQSATYNELSSKITFLLKNKMLIQEIGNKAQYFIRQKFSLKKMVTEYEDLYMNFSKRI